MRLFNTMSREKETFTAYGDPVLMYVCGVTPYDTTHLGHARTYVVFDVFQRYLRSLGLTVRYVQNVTDVDDPLFAKAKDLGVDYRDLANQYISIFLNDLGNLNVLLPSVYPRVSEEIPGIIDMIETLIARDAAYAVEGTVYFRVSAFPRYGDMGRLARGQMLAALRETGENPDDPDKEDPLDFRLWHPGNPGEPTWDSPWGPGRPGWHIECSAMALRHLDKRIDVHGGGEDLIFPHHCSEAAQSESATGQQPFAHYWMHVGLVAMDGEKMSKSKGNLAFVRDLVPVFGADALRFYLLSHQYREPFEYFERELDAAATAWRTIASACAGQTNGSATSAGEEISRRALGALDDDLNTPSALSAIGKLAASIERSDNGGDRAALRSLVQTIGFRLEAGI